jgi:microcystin-dependent protein
MTTGPNNGGWYTWSQTAANNATFDNTVNWSSGMAPSAVSPSGRAMMASVAKGLADISGSILTTGTPTAYIVSSNQQFDSTTDFNGQMIAFTPHATNGAGPVTMTVDGFPNLPLRSAPNTELLAGTLIQGTPYTATYNNTDGALYLQSFYGNPYNIPLGGLLDSTIATPPNSSFVIPNGQAISRTTYAPYFALVGTSFGPGDGSTTFNIINLQGRVTAMMEATPTLLTTAGFGGNSSVIGAVNTKGGETETLTAAQIPTITSTGGELEVSVATSTDVVVASTIANPNLEGGPSPVQTLEGASLVQVNSNGSTTSGQSVTSNNTGGQSHSNVQPTGIVQKFLRVL